MSGPVFVVMGTSGEYSDRVEWAVCWHMTEASAQDYAMRLKAKSDAVLAKAGGYTTLRYERYAEARAEIGDPGWVADYTGTDYYVLTVQAAP